MNFFLSSKTFSYYIPQIWLQVKKIQPLLFAQGSCLEERIGRQIRGTPWTNTWEVACYFEYKFLDFYNQFFLSSKRCTSYIQQISLHVNKNQPLLFAQGGCLEEKRGTNLRGVPWTNMWEVACYFEYKFLNFDNQFFFIIQNIFLLYTTNFITS